MIFLNQKMNLTKNELTNLIDDIKELEVTLIPTMPLLSLASEKFKSLGSQDVSEHESGAYTGQTSIKTLKSLGIKYCLIGHSEKRNNLYETDDKIIKKIELCTKYDITPIFIIGETIDEYNNNISKAIIEKEISAVFNNLHCSLNNIIICYEPNWSIGANSPTKEYIEDIVSTIKSIIKDYYNVELPILYGGGINEQNIKELKNLNNIDGYLIGGASLKAESIKQIYEMAK